MSAPRVGVRAARRSSKRPTPVLVLVSALVAAACGGAGPASPTGSTPSAPSATPTISGLPSTTEPLVSSLPDVCQQGVPSPDADIAFVAEGEAWAVGADGQGLTCLFAVSDPGLFSWGPKADRVVLSGLEVRGVGSAASRPATSLDPASASWGRPTGLALAFVDDTGTKIEKAIVGGAATQDVSPFDNVTYQDVVYHPSGLALGFVLTDSDGSSIWISSNTGADPKKMVFSDQGTIFGPLAFDQDGTALFYGAQLADGEHIVSALELQSAVVTDGLWRSQRGVLRVIPQAEVSGLLVDAGSDCSDSQALFSTQDGGEGTPLLPDSEAPTTALGWIDASRVLVGQGSCSEPMDLWVVDAHTTRPPVLLAQDVDRASLRVPDPLPTPPLPDIGVTAGVG